MNRVLFRDLGVRRTRSFVVAIAVAVALIGTHAVGVSSAMSQTATPVRPSVPPADSTNVVRSWVLPEITVVATRMPVASIDVPALVYSDQAIDPAASLADLLQRSGAVHIRSYGPGGLATMALRGASSSQTALYLDGFVLSNAQLGQFDLGLLPAAFLDRVEIMTGSSSALYGSSALGGAINIESIGSRGVPSSAGVGVGVAVGAGAFGERSLDLSGKTRFGKFDITAAFRVAETKGRYMFMNRALLPATMTRRVNADRHDLSGLMNLNYDGRQVQVRGNLLVIDADRGLPGVAGALPALERQNDRLVRATATVRLKATRTNVVLASIAELSELRYSNPSLGIDDTGTITRSGLRFALGPWNRAAAKGSLSGELDVSRAEHPELTDLPSRTNASLAGTGTVSWNGVNIYPSARLDVFDFVGGRRARVLSPRVGASRRLSYTYPISVKFGVGRAFRMPTFNDLYWRSAGAVGNPDLRAESSWSADVGSGWFGDAASTEVAVFARWTRDEISWQPDRTGRWRPENIGSVRAHGVQLKGRSAIPAGPFAIGVEAGYTFARARSAGDASGRFPRYNPEHVGSMFVSFRWSGLFSELGASGAGSRYVTTDGSQSLPAYVVAVLRVGGTIDTRRVRTTARVSIENVTNTEYAIVQGYPMPLRHLRVLITTTLK